MPRNKIVGIDMTLPMMETGLHADEACWKWAPPGGAVLRRQASQNLLHAAV